MLLELCITSAEGMLAARACGAHRVELCSALILGGLTPSDGLLRTCLEISEGQVPIRVLIRPRQGDFCYSDWEFKTMLEDIARCRALGAEGIVSGVLLPDGRVDEARTAQMVEAARGLGFTFHRAFDQARDPFEALEAIVRCGADTLLTSGQAASAPEAASLLSQLVEAAQGRIHILAGGGIRPENAGPLLNIGLVGLHASASSTKHSNMAHRSPLPMNGAGLPDDRWAVTDPQLGAQLRALLDRI